MLRGHQSVYEFHMALDSIDKGCDGQPSHNARTSGMDNSSNILVTVLVCTVDFTGTILVKSRHLLYFVYIWVTKVCLS